MGLYAIAKKCIEAGFSVIPVDVLTKAPLISSWKEYQNKLPSLDEIAVWFPDDNRGIALICGKISGDIELIDLDNHLQDADQKFEELKMLITDNCPGLWEKLVIETTQSGGYHLFYRATNLGKNQKLAQRMVNDKLDTFIETRAEGGYVLIAPTTGYAFIQGRLSMITKIEDEERSLIIDAALSMNEYMQEVKLTNGDAAAERPGDLFNTQGNQYIIDLLLSNGWRVSHASPQGKMHLQRPGKDTRGWSATYNHYPNKLFIFSSNAYPFEPMKAYSNFQVFTALECNNDYKEAAKRLAKMGFVSTPQKQLKSKKKTVAMVTPEGDVVEEESDHDAPAVPTGDVSSDVYMVEDYLLRNYECRYNVIKSTVEVKKIGEEEFVRLSDLEMNSIWRNLNSQKKKISLQAINSILNSNFSPSFDAFLDYFGSLEPYDPDCGIDYIDDLAMRVTVDPDDTELWRSYFKKWIIGVVACATMRGLNHCCIVLVGEQGEFKSTFIRNLIPSKLKPYYAEAQINPQDKDSKFLIAESFIINLDELETSTRDEVGHLKSLMTAANIHARRAYGRYAEDLPRRASFIGSVNKGIFLTDMTGSRRFLSVTVKGNIDTNTPFDMDKVYAQAVYMLENGAQYWFDSEEIKIVNMSNQKYQVISPEEEILNMYFEPYLEEEDPDILKIKYNSSLIKLVTASEILDLLQKKTGQKLNLYKLTSYLRKLGYKSFLMRVDGKVGKFIPLRQRPEIKQDSVF